MTTAFYGEKLYDPAYGEERPNPFGGKNSVLRVPEQGRHSSMNLLPVPPSITWFTDIIMDDVPLVGGKNVSLGETVSELTSKGVKLPDGFAITAEAFLHFIREAGIDERIRTTLAKIVQVIATCRAKGCKIGICGQPRATTLSSRSSSWSRESTAPPSILTRR